MLYTSSPAALQQFYLGCTSWFFLSGQWNPLEYFQVPLWALWLCCVGAEVSQRQSWAWLDWKAKSQQSKSISCPGTGEDVWSSRHKHFQIHGQWGCSALVGAARSRRALLGLLSGFISRRKQPQLVPHGTVIKLWNEGIKYSPLGLWNCAPPALKQDF